MTKTKKIFIAAAIIGMMSFGTAQASTLTNAQISAIIGLLEAFGVNQQTIMIVRNELSPAQTQAFKEAKATAPAQETQIVQTTIIQPTYPQITCNNRTCHSTGSGYFQAPDASGNIQWWYQPTISSGTCKALSEENCPLFLQINFRTKNEISVTATTTNL